MYNQISDREVDYIVDGYLAYIDEHGSKYFNEILYKFDLFLDHAVGNAGGDRINLIKSDMDLILMFSGFVAGYDTAVVDLEDEEVIVH